MLVKYLLSIVVLAVVLFGSQKQHQCNAHPKGLWYLGAGKMIYQWGTKIAIDLRTSSIQKFAVASRTPVPLLFVENDARKIHRLVLKAPFNLSTPLPLNDFTSWSLSHDETRLYLVNSRALSYCRLNGQQCQPISCPVIKPDEGDRFENLLEANTTTAYVIASSTTSSASVFYFYKIDLKASPLACETQSTYVMSLPNVRVYSSHFVIRDSIVLRYINLLPIRGGGGGEPSPSISFFDISTRQDKEKYYCSNSKCPPPKPTPVPFYFSALKSFGLITGDSISLFSDPLSTAAVTATKTAVTPKEMKTSVYDFLFHETSSTIPSGEGCENYCNLNGLCIGNNTCQCHQNFYRSDCSLFCESKSSCSGHGECNSTGQCECDLGYVGGNCSTFIPVVKPVFPSDFSCNATLQAEGINVTVPSALDYSPSLQFLQIQSPDGSGILNLYEFAGQYIYSTSTCQSSFLSELSLSSITTPETLTHREVVCGNYKCNVFSGAKDGVSIWFVASSNQPYKVVTEKVTITFEPESFTAKTFTSVPSVPDVCTQKK